MKLILAAIALTLASFAAQAVDLTLTLTAPQAARLQAAVGVAKGLKTPGTPAVIDADGKVITPAVPGVPRDATGPEVKAYIADQLRSLVQSVERQKAMETATKAVAAPAAFDPQ